MPENAHEFNERTDVQEDQYPDDVQLLARVAALYYEHELTHAEIGKLLGLSRIKITRLLGEARESGIVTITVATETGPFAELERSLAAAYQLSQIWVVPTCPDQETLIRSLGKVAAKALKLVVGDGTKVAVGFSKSVGAISRYLRNDRVTDVQFIALVGSQPGISASYSNTHTSIEMLARAMGGDTRHVPAPIMAGDEVIAKAMLADPSISRTMELAREADVLIVGVGSLDPNQSLITNGQISSAEFEQLKEAGAVGDISARFFDANGNPIDSSVDRRVIGLSLKDFSGIPTRIGVAAGIEKRAAIYSSIRAGYVNQLVTDFETAKWLLARATEN
jgi:lsr operon transcriptional repressor